jgi:carboxyl-terminal processing protease
MKRLGWTLALASLVAVTADARVVPVEKGDARKAKAYLREVKKHLLESYIDREKMKDDRLVAAALKAMVAAMAHPDFAKLEAGTRDAVKAAVRESETIDAAIDAVSEKAPGVDLVALSDHAAQAMVRQTGDPFSRILTGDDMSKLLKMIGGGGRDDSAGVAVQHEGDRASVMYIQYGYPAYEDGLEMGDEVLEIRGRKVSAIRPEEVNDLLKLPPGDTLELKVRRFEREYLFKIAARKTAVKDVRFQSLGQGVGYLGMTIFDNSLVKEVKAALKELAREGMKGLILDLRHNPGGALPAATGVADQFLPQGLTIAKTVSHYKPSFGGLTIPGFGGDVEFKTKVLTAFEEMPMICLINGASASASELLAGALQDHKRAVLIGEKTYGKGVGQTPIPLSSMLMQRYLYLTVMRYTTPFGHEVDHKGISPDIVCPEDRRDAATFDAVWTLRHSGAIGQYIKNYPNPATRRLAQSDRFETKEYPAFDEFYAGLKTGLSRDVIREEIRRSLRRIAEDEGVVWVCDLETDRVLQRGLVELLDLLEKEK